jgi:hypothetical protein
MKCFLIGSVSEKVARYLRCSVTVIPRISTIGPQPDLYPIWGKVLERSAEGGCPKSRGLEVLTQVHDEVTLCGLFRRCAGR